MGGVPAAGASGVNHYEGALMLRLLVACSILWIGAFFLGVANAAAIPLTLPSNVAASGTGYATTAGVNFAGAAYNSGLTTQVAGKAVTVPASMRVAANAAQFASVAVRANPVGLGTTVVLAWLLPYALEKCADGSWCKREDPLPPETGGRGTVCMDSGGCVNTWPTFQNVTYVEYIQQAITTAPLPHTITVNRCLSADCLLVEMQYYRNSDRYMLNLRMAAQSPTIRPAVLADWAPVDLAPLPDSVASELSGKNISIPVDVVPSPTVVTIGLSDPYVDPVTGKTFRDVGYITPNPLNPKTADLQVARQEVDANGDPVIDPATNTAKAPEQTDDECLKHPDRVACKDWGETPDVPELPEDQRSISIVPQGGWGAGTATCPADLTASFLGKPIAWSFAPVCSAADSFRPVVLAMAWLSALMIALGVGRKGGD